MNDESKQDFIQHNVLGVRNMIRGKYLEKGKQG